MTPQAAARAMLLEEERAVLLRKLWVAVGNGGLAAGWATRRVAAGRPVVGVLAPAQN